MKKGWVILLKARRKKQVKSCIDFMTRRGVLGLTREMEGALDRNNIN